MKVFAFEPSDNVGRYWIKDSCEALMELGHKVRLVKLPVNGRPLFEIIDRLREFQPDLVFTINHIGLIPEFLKIIDKMAIPVISWFIDDPFRYLKGDSIIQNCIIFSCDKFYIKRLKEYGFPKVWYLPGATNVNVFRPIELTHQEREYYGCNISFVGNSIYHAYSTYKKYYEWIKDKDAQYILDEALRLQMRNHLLDISDILEGLEAYYRRLLPGLDLLKICIEFAAMSLYRKEMIEAVADLGMKLFGDDGWNKLLDRDILHGKIDRIELPKLYNASKINLNITKTQLKTTVNQRVFDVSACAGFILTDYRRDLNDLFEIGDEIIFYKDKEDLRYKVEYYLLHEDEVIEIARNAKKRVLNEHTFIHRIREILSIMEE